MEMSFPCCFKWDFIIGDKVTGTAINWPSEAVASGLSILLYIELS